ncbi:MAG: hypothetical protein ACOX7R_10575 [Acetivibrionales bacterium]
MKWLSSLSADLGVPKYLDDAGASKEQIPALVERAMLDNPITTNPRPCTPADVEKLYLQAFKPYNKSNVAEATRRTLPGLTCRHFLSTIIKCNNACSK